MKRVFAFLLALLCVLPALCTESYAVSQQNYIGVMRVVSSDEWVNMYAQPDDASTCVAMMWPGETLEAYSHDGPDEFLMCVYNDMTGYVLSANLEPVNGGAIVTQPSSAGGPESGNPTPENAGSGKVTPHFERDIPGAIEKANEEVRNLIAGNSGSGMTEDNPGAYMTDAYWLGQMYVVNCEEWVSLRRHPDTNSDRLAKVGLGDFVDVYNYPPNPDFYLCNTVYGHGFILKQYLDPDESALDGIYLGSKENNPGAYMNADNYVGPMRVSDSHNWVALHMYPNDTSTCLEQVYGGDYVEAYQYSPNPGFYVCETASGNIGFIWTEYLEYGTDAPAGVGPSGNSSSSSSGNSSSGMTDDRPGKWMHDGNLLGNLTVVNCEEWVSLREHPDTNSTRLAKVPLGAKVEAYYYGSNQDFYVCFYDGKVGFILKKYLTNKASGNSSSGGSSSGGMKEDRPAKYMNNQNALGEWYVTNCNEWVSLREHPDTNSKRIEKVYLNDIVQAYEYSPNANFYLCETSKGNIGFILKKYLACVMDVPDDVYYKELDWIDPWEFVYDDNIMGELTVLNCDSWVSLREQPDTSSKRLAKVPLGDTVDAYDYYIDPTFHVCIYKGQIGFILADYLGT